MGAIVLIKWAGTFGFSVKLSGGGYTLLEGCFCLFREKNKFILSLALIHAKMKISINF